MKYIIKEKRFKDMYVTTDDKSSSLIDNSIFDVVPEKYNNNEAYEIFDSFSFQFSNKLSETYAWNCRIICNYRNCLENNIHTQNKDMYLSEIKLCSDRLIYLNDVLLNQLE